MAYKIQVGTARLGGSTTFEEGFSIDHPGAHISGSVISASSDVLIHGAVGGTGMDVVGGGTISGVSASFEQTGEWLVLDSLSDQGRVQIKKDAAGGQNTELAKFYVSNNIGSLVLNSTSSNTAQVSLIEGVLSGSSGVLGGGLTVAGSNNVTVNGTLTVRSGNTFLNVGTFETLDDIVEIAESISGNGSGLAFGQTGSADSGAQIKFATTGVEERFDILDGNDEFIALSASVFYGNGSNLSGLSSLDASLSVVSKVAGNTLEVGFNKISGNGTFDLPASSGLTDGDEIIVKRADASDGAVVIDADGSDTIDGEGTITLEVANAAVVLVLSGSSFKVF